MLGFLISYRGVVSRKPKSMLVFLSPIVNVVRSSVLSVKESIRAKSFVSTYAAASVGGAASVRSFVRLGSCVSVLSGSRVGASVSVLRATRLGSAWSLRSFSTSIGVFTRFGGSLSVTGWFQFGSGTSGFSTSGVVKLTLPAMPKFTIRIVRLAHLTDFCGPLHSPRFKGHPLRLLNIGG